MTRLRPFAPFLLVLLALAGVPRPEYAPVWTAAAGAPVRDASRDSLSAGKRPPAPAYLASESVSIDRLADSNGPLVRLPPRAGAPHGAGAAAPRVIAPEHSRVRALQRARLGFSAALAAARAGTLSSQSTSLPPPRTA